MAAAAGTRKCFGSTPVTRQRYHASQTVRRPVQMPLGDFSNRRNRQSGSNYSSLPLPGLSLSTSRHSRLITVHVQGSETAQGMSDPERKEHWGIFDWQRYQEKWDVPWGLGWVAGRFALLIASWCAICGGVNFIACWLMHKALGLDLGSVIDAMESGNEPEHVFFACQVLIKALMLTLIWWLTRKKMGESGSKDLFRMDLREPFSKPRGWAVWALLGVVLNMLNPLVWHNVALLMSIVVHPDSMLHNVTGTHFASQVVLNLPSYFSQLISGSILTPILEEMVFRGFLLASLTKFMPTWVAVVASSLIFGLVHLSMRELPAIFACGMLLGFMYVRSRNLMTPMLIHGVWNLIMATGWFWLRLIN